MDKITWTALFRYWICCLPANPHLHGSLICGVKCVSGSVTNCGAELRTRFLKLFLFIWMFPLPLPAPQIIFLIFSEKQRWANKWCKRKNVPVRRSYFCLQIQWMNCPPGCREKPRSDISNECRRETTAPLLPERGHGCEIFQPPWSWRLGQRSFVEPWEGL